MKTLIVDGIRKLNVSDNYTGRLDVCEYCGATNVKQHIRRTTMCDMCGKRFDRYMNHQTSLRKKFNLKSNEHLGKVFKEYSDLAAQGYKVPDEIKGYIEGRID